MKSNVFKKTVSASRDLVVDNLIVNGSSNIIGYVDLNSVQTLTNKIISSSNNTLTGVLTLNGAQTMTNKNIDCVTNSIYNVANGNVSTSAAIAVNKIGNQDVDNTKFSYLNSLTSNVQTQLDGKITTSSTDVLTNKSIDATTNTITNIGDSSVIVGINANKIGNGIVSTQEFNYLDGLVSNIQTQLNSRITTSSTDVLTNKSISALTNTISNIGDSSVIAGINTNKIGNADVDNTKLSYLNSTTSNVQTQLNTKASLSGVETLNNKTISALSNTITDIGNSSVIAGIDASKISTGLITNTEFNTLDNVSSNIQSQLDDKVTLSSAQTIVANKIFESASANNNNIQIKNTVQNNCSISFTNAFSLNSVRLRKVNDDISFEISNTQRARINSDNFELTNGGKYYINSVEIKDVSETLTNKTIAFGSNTLSDISSLSTNQTFSGIKDFSTKDKLTVATQTVHIKRNSTTTDPTTANDNTQGYEINSIWFNTVTSSRWIADDVTTNNAMWRNTNHRSVGHSPYTTISLLALDSYVYITADYNYYSQFSIIAYTDCTCTFEMYNLSTAAVIATSATFGNGSPFGPDIITTTFSKIKLPPGYTIRFSVKNLTAGTTTVFATSTD